VEVHCSRCHLRFDLATDDKVGPHCPRCKAEAGLERVMGVPLPMRLFGALLGTVLVAALAGGIMSRLVGA
jgi:hypothetical protein